MSSLSIAVRLNIKIRCRDSLPAQLKKVTLQTLLSVGGIVFEEIFFLSGNIYSSPRKLAVSDC